MQSRILLTVLYFFLASLLFGQDNFTQLSTKERIKIAENEEKAAGNDEQFQKLMQNGHNLFKEKHYLKAIHTYEQAQDRRPYNVYPKVIISDIELSMKDTLLTLRAAEKVEAQKEKLEKKEKPIQVKEKVDEPKPESEEERRAKLEKWENQERAKRERERELEKQKAEEEKPQAVISGDVKILTTDDLREELGQKYPDGITEETTTEGNKTIIKRVVVSNNLGNEYKRVIHNWGGVFYFKNGEAVTERVWTEETEK